MLSSMVFSSPPTHTHKRKVFTLQGNPRRVTLSWWCVILYTDLASLSSPPPSPRTSNTHNMCTAYFSGFFHHFQHTHTHTEYVLPFRLMPKPVKHWIQKPWRTVGSPSGLQCPGSTRRTCGRTRSWRGRWCRRPPRPHRRGECQCQRREHVGGTWKSEWHHHNLWECLTGAPSKRSESTQPGHPNCLFVSSF